MCNFDRGRRQLVLLRVHLFSFGCFVYFFYIFDFSIKRCVFILYIENSDYNLGIQFYILMKGFSIFQQIKFYFDTL